MSKRLPISRPAFALLVVLLFTALSGTAVAAGVVPLAKKALFANNAGKLQGKTVAQVAALPGPATGAVDLVATRTTSISIPADAARVIIVACQAGEKALSGGYTSNGVLVSAATAPTSDGASWQLALLNLGDSTATGTAYAVCVK
jgi:hypothetical protein